ncbi:Cytochrome P450 [Pandoravirus quercus]|uniref:Cytochrome P450 n=2 Tax=Pandoravirus TaxID=2060084 RepID=A0A2U7U8Z0_9VIRU|nr:Cytochrome P450 [Pandoravirus quercus]AVK74903.1 Cytochrome P450 [Pandoravirus quercus]QBZ81089.1 Cytochrome P450 domain containing protein [Pandoravirus celtis]
MMILLATLAATALFLAAILGWTRARPDGRRLPPTLPGAHPLWGHTRSLLHPIESLHQRLGPLARDHPGAVTLCVGPTWLPAWLSPPIVMLSDPALVREAFAAANGPALAHEPEIMENVQTVMGRGLLGIDGPAWQARRGYVLSTFFSLKALGAAAHVVDRHSARAVAILESRADPMAPVDLYTQHLVPLMLAIIVELICGVDVAADHDGTDKDTPVPRSLARDMGLVFDEVNDRTFRLLRTLRPTSSAYQAAFARARDYIDGLVRRRVETGAGGCHDLISTLVAGQDLADFQGVRGDPIRGDADSDEALEAAKARRAARNPYTCEADVRAEAILFMFAGFESTSSTLAYTIHLLAHHTDVQERVRAEAAQWRHGSAGPHDALGAMPLAEAVLREAMRIHPITHMLTRRMARDLPLGDVHVVPSGARLLINNLGMSNAEHAWDDPTAFRPERWMGAHEGADSTKGGETAAPDQYASLPFGAGRRSCPGRRLAVLEMKLILATLLARFRFAPDPDRPGLERRVAFVMRPHNYSVLCTPIVSS